MAGLADISDRFTRQGYQRTLAFDPVLRTDFISGYRQTRLRTTWCPWQWQLNYQQLSVAQRDALADHEQAHAAGDFYWAESAGTSQTVYHVRYSEPVVFTVGQGSLKWDVAAVIEQVDNESAVLNPGDYGYGLYGDGNYLGI